MPRDRQYELINSFLCAHPGELLLFFLLLSLFTSTFWKMVYNHVVSERIVFKNLVWERMEMEWFNVINIVLIKIISSSAISLLKRCMVLFFHQTQNQLACRMSTLLFSMQLKWMVTVVFKLPKEPALLSMSISIRNRLKLSPYELNKSCLGLKLCLHYTWATWGWVWQIFFFFFLKGALSHLG